MIDVNVHLFRWPFRRLRGDDTAALAALLQRQQVTQAWAGSFEALLHRDIRGVNDRLAAECQRHKNLLVPFGTVHPLLPDWEEDLRRCHEEYRMPGLRLYPAYHGYMLDQPEFARLLGLAGERGLVVQIAIRMEDERVHHPAIDAPVVDAAPLPGVLKMAPQARVQLPPPPPALLCAEG